MAISFVIHSHRRAGIRFRNLWRASAAVHVPARGGNWQCGLRDVLAVILAVCVLLAASRVFSGGLGVLELGLLAISSTSVLLSGIFTRTRWPWPFALIFGLVALCSLAPVSLATKSALACAVSAAYLVAGLPAIIVAGTNTRLWPWMIGSVACFLQLHRSLQPIH